MSLLLNPGPVTLSSRVRQALTHTDLCHREPEFATLQNEIRERLARVYEGTEQTHSAVLLTGSGTAAVEAMVGSLVPRDGCALVIENGVYGERMTAMLRAQGKRFETVRSEWSASIDLTSVAERLRGGAFSHVLAVHHETTTGRLNDLPSLGALCREYRTPMLLDCVSSFAGEPLDLESWNVEACAGTANKCIHGAPGISFVLVRDAVMRARTSAATSLYLDLFVLHADQQRGSTTFTPAVHVCHALREALIELNETGGWRARHARYTTLSRRVFDELRAQGVEPLLPIDAPSSSVLTAYRVPAGITYDALHDHLKREGFIIYAGQGAFNQRIFRISLMGDVQDADVTRLLSVLSEALRNVSRSQT